MHVAEPETCWRGCWAIRDRRGWQVLKCVEAGGIPGVTECLRSLFFNVQVPKSQPWLYSHLYSKILIWGLSLSDHSSFLSLKPHAGAPVWLSR